MIEKLGYKFYNQIMDDFEKLYKEYLSLPNGYISKKVIHGDEYYYLQYFSNGTLVSKYLSKGEVSKVQNQINRRRELKALIKEHDEYGSNLVAINKNRKELTGSLMSGDNEVAKFVNGVLTYIDNDKAPLYIKRTHNLTGFLSKRVIDESRTNSRLLKKILSIKEEDSLYISLRAHGAVITDNFWFKPKGSKTSYKDIIFSDVYADVALKGQIRNFSSLNKLSPELTLVGSYEKCWKKRDDLWWIYKHGNQNELFSELFASLLAKRLGIPTVKHELENEYIKSLNFASNYNYEPISSLADNDDNYDRVFNILFDINQNIAIQYLYLMWFDALINNIDRHNENYGLLRDKYTGEIISLAPNFDNNLCLISINPNLTSNFGLINAFKKFINNKTDNH